MKRCIYFYIFIMTFQGFCIQAWSAEKNANDTKDLLSNKDTIKRISIQVASLKDENKASQELAWLKSRGLEAFMRHEVAGDKGMSYRIYIGRFKNYGDAKKIAQDLKDQGLISSFWIKSIAGPSDLKKSSQRPTRQKVDPADSGDPDHSKKDMQLQAIAGDQQTDGSFKRILTIQVVSLKDQAKATQELSRLKSHDLEVFMRHEAVGDKGMWYRVYVGRFPTRKEATQYAQKIKDQKIISDAWVKTIKITKEQKPTPLPSGKPTEKPELKAYVGATKPETVVAPAELLTPAPPPEAIPLLEQIPTKPEKTASPIKPQEVPSKIPEDSSPEPDRLPSLAEKEAEKVLEQPEIISEAIEAPNRQAIAAQGPRTRSWEGRFSLGLRTSYFQATKAKDFIIERNRTSRDAWSFQDDKIYSAIFSSFQLSPEFFLDVSIEKAFFTKLDLWHLTVGPKFNLKKINILTPYLRGGLVIGHLEWDDAPGDFKPGLGFEGGLGLSLIRSNIQFGIEAAYRAIKYDYNTPSDTGVSATDDTLDLSGFGISAILNYQF